MAQKSIIPLAIIIAFSLGPEGREINSDLLDAVESGDAAKVQAVLKRGADPNAREKGGRTALMIAAVEGYAAIVQELVSAGADVNATSGPGITPLMAAAGAGRTTVVELLVRLGADVNAKADRGITALMMAAVNDHASTVQSLVHAGADVNAKTVRGGTASAMAASEGHSDVVQILRQSVAKETSENICIDFDKHEDWRCGDRQDSEQMTLTEFVKRGETVEDWTELVTITTAKNVPNLSLDQWLQIMEQQHKAHCSKGQRFEVKGRAEISGRPAVIYVARCEKLAKSPDSDRTVWGKPETSVHLDVLASPSIYGIQRAARRSDLSEATVNEWVDFLKTARICDSPTALPPCKD